MSPAPDFEPFVLDAPAKINLGLWVRLRRADGYHEIETVFYPLHELHDRLTFRPTPGDEPTLRLKGGAIPGDPAANLCLKAWRLLRESFGSRVAAVDVELEKRIPVGGGLGGGSSDAAACLLAFDRIFGLGVGVEGLREFALCLGADVPFFLDPRPMLATGIGEILTPIDLPPLGRVEVVFTGVHSDTGQAYRELNLSRCTAKGSLLEELKRPVAEWRGRVTNDFEADVFARIPQLAAAKQALYDRNAAFALMSGSGSAVYGVFVD